MSEQYSNFSSKARKNQIVRGKSMFVLLRGIVEFNADPLGLGRTKIRIPTLHGVDDSELKTEELPWASPCIAGGAGNDFGSFDVPPVGGKVWVLFEAGNVQYPIYFGSWYAITEEATNYLSTESDIFHEGDMTGDDGKTAWITPPGSELPEELVMLRNYTPNINILKKSLKGATLLIDDRDEAETTRILDRLGQKIEFIGRVKDNENLGNAFRRANAETSSSTDIRSKLRDNGSIVRLSDILDQRIEFKTFQGVESVEMVSRLSDGLECRVRPNAGSGRIDINVTRNGVVKSELQIDQHGRIRIVGEDIFIGGKRITIDVEETITIKSDVVVHGNLRVEQDATIGGKLREY